MDLCRRDSTVSPFSPNKSVSLCLASVYPSSTLGASTCQENRI